MSDTGITLEWKAFEPTINNAFQNLYTDESLTDVTLASEGNKQVLAHKVVISSCSSFFKNILGMNRNSHPLIYLQGVSYDDIVLLKRFMYLGKASVAEENVNSFVTLSKIFLNKSPREIKEERVSSANLDVWYEHFPSGITDSISKSENIEISMAPMAKTGLIPGLYVWDNFITEEEEKSMIKSIDAGKWTKLLNRRVQHFGYEFKYGTNNVDTN